MDQYDYLTREQLLSMVRALGQDQAAASDAVPAGAEGLPVFGEIAMREFEACASPMRIFDTATLRYLAVNDAAVTFYGYSREEFLRLTIRDTRHPEEHGRMLAMLGEQQGGYLRHVPIRRHIKRSGEVMLVETVTQDVIFNGRKARLSLTLDMTGRIRMQELLWQRQQEFESLAEHLPDLVARYDRDGRFIYANAAIESALGIERGRVIGRTQREIGLPEELVSLYSASRAEVFSTAQPHRIEFKLTLATGERQFEAFHVPDLGPDGAVASMLCVARDVTGYKRTTEELDRQRQLLDAVVENLPLAVFVRDAKGRYVRRNRFAKLRFGAGAQAEPGTTTHDYFPKELAEKFLDSDRRLFESRKAVEIPEQLVTDLETGATRVQRVHKIPLYDEKGEPWLIVGVADDITALKEAQAMESRLAAIVNNSSDAIVSKDLDGMIRTWNPGAERLFGYSAEEMIGRPASNLMPPDRLDEEELILARIRRGERVEAFESIRVRRDGTRVHVSLTISPICDTAGQVIGASQIARDITERKQSELATLRNAALARLLESLARAANEAVTPEQAMVACLDRICRHGNWTLGRVAMFEGGGPLSAPSRSIWHVSNRARFSEFIAYSDRRAPNPRGRFMGRVLSERVPVWIEDFKDQLGYQRRELAVASGLQSAFGFPIIARGEVVALMEVFSEERRPPDAFIIGAVPSIASQLARIIERERAHEADARMAALVESSQDAILTRSLDGAIQTWNAGAERLFGYTAKEIIGRNIEVLYPPELVPEMRRRQGLLEEGRPVAPYETVRLTKDGRRIHVSTSPAPIRDASGRICGASTIIHDLTSRRAAEEALRESEERFRQLAENVDQVFWINNAACDDNLYVSPVFEKVWGRSRESLRSEPNSWKESVHPDDRQRLKEALEGIARGRHMDVEYRIVRPDGTIRWIRDRSYPMNSADGRDLVCGLAEDITDIKLAEQERLTHAFHQRDALVREVHHRIKNNLQGVIGLLRQKTRKHPKMAAEIEEAIIQLQTVAVVYGLQSTRADGLVSLADMVEAICASAESLIGGRVDRVFERSSARPACVEETEAVSMAVALNELVFNALKHQRAAAGKKRATVAVMEKARSAEIRIVNRGRLPKGFDYDEGRATGTGLGLVRTLLVAPGARLEYVGRRGVVETVLTLAPPLLAERPRMSTRRLDGETTGAEKAAAAHTGRG